MASSNAIEQIKSDEGRRNKGYMIDGVLHIGVGFNLERADAEEQLIMAGVSPTDVDEMMKEGGKEIGEEQIDALFQNSLLEAEAVAESFAGNKKVPQPMQDALVNMSYQLGPKSLSEFKDMKTAVSKGEWKTVQSEMADSKWAKTQTPKRAKRLINSISDLPAPEAPAPEIQVNPKMAMNGEKQQRIANRLGAMLSKSNMVNKMGKALAESQAKEAEQNQTNKVEQ